LYTTKDFSAKVNNKIKKKTEKFLYQKVTETVNKITAYLKY
jgi:hypothetical protein